MKILVADDDKTSIIILDTILKQWGYNPILVEDGQKALDLLKNDKEIKLAILDWVMPQIDGIDICKTVKKNHGGHYIILITSKNDKEAISTALNNGADDFLTKPFDTQELKARLDVGKRTVELYLKISNAQKKLQTYAHEMESLAQEKANQLIHAERLSSIGLLTAGIAHEINNPTTFIFTNLNDLKKFWDIINEFLEKQKMTLDEKKQFEFILKEIPEIINGIKLGAERIATIVSGLKTFARMDISEKNFFDIHTKIDESLMLCSNALKYNVEVTKNFCSKELIINGTEQKITQVFVNIFTNAADAMANQKKGKLHIETTQTDKYAQIKIADNGGGFTDKVLKKIWDPFFTTKPVGKGTGLGMAISHGIIKEHDGEIIAQNTKDNSGAEFIISLPI